MSGITWQQKLQSQTWYQDVADTFTQIAPSVPTEVWQGELEIEDSSLDPTAQDYLHSGHWGLFQESQTFPTTVGLPAASVQELQDPRYNAKVAAIAMQRAIQNSGATTYPQMVQALQEAGWPGTPAPAGDLEARVAAIAALAGGNGPTASSAPTSTSRPSWCDNPLDLRNYAPGPWSNWQFPSIVCDVKPAVAHVQQQVQQQVQQTSGDVGAAIQSGVANLGKMLLVGGVILGMLAGGFYLLAASVGSAPAPPIGRR